MISLLLTGCDEADLFKGKWKLPNNEIWIFNSDHTLTIINPTKDSILYPASLKHRLVNGSTPPPSDWKIKWYYDAKSHPNGLDFSIYYLNFPFDTINCIQEFTSKTDMRIGYNGSKLDRPESWPAAKTKVKLVRQ